jgi:mono/diheme cytochrome c family protein
MTRLSYTVIVMLATLGALGVGVGAFVESGLYNMGADDHHTKLVFAAIEQLRERSIATHANGITTPSDLAAETRIAAGARRYATLCAGCHLAPGLTHSELRTGLYPHPPNLAQAEIDAAPRTFWVIKHGLKMSAMPAWGKSLDDAALWDLVAFVRKMPDLTPEAYQALSQGTPGVPEVPGATANGH